MAKKWVWIAWGVGGVLVITIPAAIMSQGEMLEEAIWNQYIPELASAKDVKQKYKDTGCLGSYFGDINWGDITTKTSESPSIPEFNESNIDSCLTVASRKKTYKDKKWTGSFKLVWSLKDGTNGLITVVEAKANKGTLKLSSVAYLTEYTNNSWEIKYAKENDELVVDKEKPEESLFNNFPQPGNIEKYANFQFFWGFSHDFKKICENDDCDKQEVKRTTSSTTWIFSKNQTAKSNITNWSSALDTWLEQSFGLKGLCAQLEKIKGEWKLKATPNLGE